MRTSARVFSSPAANLPGIAQGPLWCRLGVACLVFLLLGGALSAEAAAAVRLRIIVTATAHEALEIQSLLRNGATFARLAKERSIDKSSRQYGELDSAAIGRLPAQLRTVIASMREGDVSRTLRIDEDHYALLQYIDLRQYRLGAAAFRAGNFDQAEEHLRRHITENPDALKARCMLAEIFRNRGLSEKALALYSEVLTLDPGNPDAAAGKNLLSRSEKTLSLPEAGEPRPPVRDAVSEDATANLPRDREQVMSRAVPVRLIIVDSQQKAADLLNELRRGKPFFFLAHDNSLDRKSADEYGDLGVVDPLTLHPALQEALTELRPGGTSTEIRLGERRYAIIQLKDTERYARAEKAIAAGEQQQAEQHLREHLRLNPDDLGARMLLASLYEEQRKPDAAEDVYQQALVFKPRAPGPYERLGKLYIRQQQFGKAGEIITRGLRLASERRILNKLMEIVTLSHIGTVQ